MSRALRRHHRQRLKHARKAYWGHGRSDPMGPVILARVVDTPHPCSKECCGNPRRHFGERTLQEQRFVAEALVDDTASGDSLDGETPDSWEL